MFIRVILLLRTNFTCSQVEKESAEKWRITFNKIQKRRRRLPYLEIHNHAYYFNGWNLFWLLLTNNIASVCVSGTLKDPLLYDRLWEIIWDGMSRFSSRIIFTQNMFTKFLQMNMSFHESVILIFYVSFEKKFKSQVEIIDFM